MTKASGILRSHKQAYNRAVEDFCLSHAIDEKSQYYNKEVAQLQAEIYYLRLKLDQLRVKQIKKIKPFIKQVKDRQGGLSEFANK